MTDLPEIKKILDNQLDILQDQRSKVDDIHFAIFGNERAGVKGLAKIVEGHGKAIAEYKRLKWIGTGLTIGGWAGFIAWIKNYFGI